MSIETLNKAAIEELFNANSVFIGKNDVILRDTAIQLLGKKAVERANKQGVDWNAYGYEENNFYYLYKQGFFNAASFRNLEALKKGLSQETTETTK